MLEHQRQLFRTVKPDLKRQLTPAESAIIVPKVANDVAIAHACRMLSHTGTEEWLSRHGWLDVSVRNFVVSVRCRQCYQAI